MVTSGRNQELTYRNCGIFCRITQWLAHRGPFLHVLVCTGVLVAGHLCFAASRTLPRLEHAPGGVWKEKVFHGQTTYESDWINGEYFVRAMSRGTASGLILEQKIDLRTTPILQWSWKVEHALQGLQERTKSGDDYAARVYVVASGGMAFWKTRALSYVWSGSEPRGSIWTSAFTDNARMIAVESGPSQAGSVVPEKRNVIEDWKRAFGDDLSQIDAIAIMTDTDNSGLSATAWYSTPFFSSE